MKSTLPPFQSLFLLISCIQKEKHNSTQEKAGIKNQKHPSPKQGLGEQHCNIREASKFISALAGLDGKQSRTSSAARAVAGRLGFIPYKHILED